MHESRDVLYSRIGGCSTAGKHRNDVDQEGCRAGGMLDRRDPGQQGCRFGGMKDSRGAGLKGWMVAG